MRWSVLLLLLVLPCLAEDLTRPPCNARNRGQFWPEQANSDREAARQAARCGELQVCTVGLWRHHWEPLTVHVTQLGKGARQEIPGCGKPAAIAPSRSATPAAAAVRRPAS